MTWYEERIHWMRKVETFIQVSLFSEQEALMRSTSPASPELESAAGAEGLRFHLNLPHTPGHLSHHIWGWVNVSKTLLMCHSQIFRGHWIRFIRGLPKFAPGLYFRHHFLGLPAAAKLVSFSTSLGGIALSPPSPAFAFISFLLGWKLVHTGFEKDFSRQSLG